MTSVRGGWSRTLLPITDEMLVLDLGSGAFPNPRADILCDRDLADNCHRGGRNLVVDRPMVRADAGKLPFRDGTFDFVIASHIAEHLEDPESFCSEISRVAEGGYIETPSPIADRVLHEDYHLWRVALRRGVLVFDWKLARKTWERRTFGPIYKVFYAEQGSCAQPTYRSPPGWMGRVIGLSLRTLGGVLNRLGIMHTRCMFTPMKPLRCEIRGVSAKVK